MPTYDLPTGARLETLEQGSGPPFIALHGLAGTAKRHLGDVIQWLTGDKAPNGPYRVIGPSLRGYGGSHPVKLPNLVPRKSGKSGFASGSKSNRCGIAECCVRSDRIVVVDPAVSDGAHLL